MNFSEIKTITNLCRLNLEEQFKKITYYNPSTNYVVIWYGAIIRLNNHPHSSKGVEVFVSDLAGSFVRVLSVPLGVIPKMPIGSIWQGGRCKRRLSFDEYYSVIQENVDNAQETNIFQAHRNNEQNKDFFKLFDNAFGFNLLTKDLNTLIVKQGDENSPTFIIHPLTFFNAHYGISKEINRILVTYFWGEENINNTDTEITVRKLLHLDYINPNYPEAVFIPDRLNISDAIFIYHLRNDEYSERIVQKLNSRIINNFINNARIARENNSTGLRRYGHSFLKVRPYHTQPIEITFEGLPLGNDSNMVLCTNITGISMPMGDSVLFDIKGSINSSQEDGQSIRLQRVKPLACNLDLEEIVLSNEQPNNRNTTIIRQKIRTIGEARETIKNSDLPIGDELLRGQIITIEEALPEKFGAGERKGINGNIGSLKSLLEFDTLADIDGFFEATSPYARLLQQAQELRDRDRYFYGMTINCFSLNNGELGEVVKPIRFCGRTSFPTTIFILKLVLNYNQTYFVIDCSFNEGITNYATSGYLIKVLNETEFLNKKNPLGLQRLINEIGRNQGRMSEIQYEELRNRQLIVKYKHMSSPNSNWLRNAFNGLSVT